MASHNQLGQQGEDIATKHLLAKGFKILERNWRFGKDELDIIAKHGDELIIVEVKTRNSDYFGNPNEAVSTAKQKRLTKAAHAYIIENDLDVETRFDIIGVIMNKNEQRIEHIEGAFIPRW
ncbi:MAG: YraN family protein [Salibacteraceae bacterium]